MVRGFSPTHFLVGSALPLTVSRCRSLLSLGFHASTGGALVLRGQQQLGSVSTADPGSHPGRSDSSGMGPPAFPQCRKDGE